MNSETPRQDEDSIEDQRVLNIADDLEDKEDKTAVAKRQVAMATPVVTLSMGTKWFGRDDFDLPPPRRRPPTRKEELTEIFFGRTWSSGQTKKRTGEVGRRIGKKKLRIGKKNSGLRGHRWRTI